MPAGDCAGLCCSADGLPGLHYCRCAGVDRPDASVCPSLQLLNPHWYWSDLLDEPQRYSPGLGPPGRHYLLRPGLSGHPALLPASLAALTLQAVRRGDAAARAVLVPARTFPVLFALLITLKLANYTVTVLPMAALAVAWGASSLWRWAGHKGRSRRLTAIVRVMLCSLLVVVAAEGATRIAGMDAAAAAATPYATYMQRVRAHIPAGSRVIGLPYYWLGLYDFDYLTWLVPISRAPPRIGCRRSRLGPASTVSRRTCC